MKVVNVSEVPSELSAKALMKIIFGGKDEPNAKVTFGTAVFPPGARVPQEGTGKHEGDEYSLILKGSLVSFSGGEKYRLSAGQASLIPAGEEHWSLNDGNEDCKVVWVLVKK